MIFITSLTKIGVHLICNPIQILNMVDVMAAAMYPSVSLGIPGRSALTPPNKSF